MPISKLQSDILKVIAKARDPESFVAGGLPINRTGQRYSKDVDIFHDREERVRKAARDDVGALEQAGYTVAWIRREPAIHSAEIRKGDDFTKLEWVADSDFRYFPAIPDPDFGYVLHVIDLAMNKVMAAAGRREPRDLVDLMRIHDEHLPLGAVVWGSVVIAPGFTPEGLLNELQRNARYTAGDFAALPADPPIDASELMTEFRAAVREAQDFVAQMPTDAVGTLYLENGKPVQPDPERLDDYVTHQPKRRGHWPTSSALSSAMLDKLKKPAP